jgi:hypothetical protein
MRPRRRARHLERDRPAAALEEAAHATKLTTTKGAIIQRVPGGHEACRNMKAVPTTTVIANCTKA